MKDALICKNYTLEKHLKSLCSEDSDYELLYSIWDLNKKNLTQGLSLISSTYPHYSTHDISHSLTIINNIQCLLGADRIKLLGATDTFLILMACLTHDIGMILTYKIIEEEWQKDNFKEILKTYANSNDVIIAKAAQLLLEKGYIVKQSQDHFNWALEIKNAVTILTAEIFRNKHAKQSAEYLLANEEFKRLADNYYSEQLPSRFIDLLAKIALLHGENFDELMSRLYLNATGYKGDYIHPRFIACMIRLGDLLDFDSNRFNMFSMASIKEVPDESILHQQKHAAVRHLLISPTSIEAEVDCPNENVYRIARNWFDWLEEEVNNQSREWSNIAPQDLGGLPPIISKDSIRILYRGIQAKPDLLNLKFVMSQKKIFDILRGGGIYKEPGFAFIREIVQNAFDASKLQLWSDIESGMYDLYFNNKTIESIAFPDDIAQSIYNQYPINLTIKWLDETKETIRVECTDRGTGISEATLLRMTKHVGDSHRHDQNYNNNYTNMPYWLRPTAAFGIGLQSIFFVAKTFEVQTAFPGEKAKRIIFRSAADDQYCSIVEEDITRKRGTTIIVDIKKERFPELFGTTFEWNVLSSVDMYYGDGDDIYVAKLDNFVFNTFRLVQNLCFQYDTINQERSFCNSIITKSNKKQSANEQYKFSYLYENDFLVFDFLEKNVGSSFSLKFNDDMGYNHLSQQLLLRDVLVSNAKFNFFRTGYLGFEWNLNNQATDTIVDLSRDNLTYTGKQWINNTLLYNILPETLKLISDTFVQEIDNTPEHNSSLKIQYLNYCLSALACGVDDFNDSRLSMITMPSDIVSYNQKTITADKLITAQTLILIKNFKTTGADKILREEINRIENQYRKILKNNIVLWGDSYLESALIGNYFCSNVLVYTKNCIIYKLEKITKTIPYDNKLIPFVQEYLLALNNVGIHKCSRNTIYGLSKYPNISVKKYWVSGFEHFPSYSSCCIYSPFTNKKEIDGLLQEFKNTAEGASRINLIKTKLSLYISPFMMTIIRNYNINPDVTDEQIKEDYISLIYDFIQLTLNNSKAESKNEI